MDMNSGAGWSDLMGLGLIAVAVACLLCIAVVVFVVYLVYQAMLGVPEKYRPLNPSLVWILLIPLVGLVWLFFVFPPMMKAYKEALDERKLTVDGDGGHGLALACCICNVCGFIPVIGMLAGLAGLVLFIVVLVKAFEHKKRLAAA
jgi:hypothetical protein